MSDTFSPSELTSAKPANQRQRIMLIVLGAVLLLVLVLQVPKLLGGDSSETAPPPATPTAPAGAQAPAPAEAEAAPPVAPPARPRRTPFDPPR